MGGGLLPRVVENMLDAKVELDGRLRTIINEFTTFLADRITAPISSPTTKRGAFDTSTIQQIKELVDREVPLLRRKLDEYLDDYRTKETLVSAVQDQVVQNYETFYERLTAEKRSNGKTVSKKGKGRDDEAWDVDTFAEAVGEVFKIGRVGLGIGGRGEGESEGAESRSRSLSRDGSV